MPPKRKRDVDTFEKINPDEVEDARARKHVKLDPCINWNEWVAATATKNFMVKDPLLDWLGCHYAGGVGGGFTPGETVKYKTPNNFTEFIMNQGKEFERNLINHLYQKFGTCNIEEIAGDFDARSEQKCKDTLAAMNKGIPIIHSAVLRNADDQTFGVADLLIRSDWFSKIFKIPPIDTEEIGKSAKRLKAPGTAKAPAYHYRVADIKFTTLNLRSNGIHILNAGLTPAYKSQLLIYTRALAKLQGYNPKEAYIIGRRWKYTSKNVDYNGDSCLDRVGVIDYREVDLDFIEETDKAIQWVKEVRKDGAKWSIIPSATGQPLLHPHLYPNMSNSYDYPWHHVKERIATDIKEISDLWMCGVKQRVEAHRNGVYKWNDDACTTEVLMGLKSPKKVLLLPKRYSRPL